MYTNQKLTKEGLEWAERELLTKPNTNPYTGMLKTVRELLTLHNFAQDYNIDLGHKCNFWRNNICPECGGKLKED
jgi:hypothetical protein